LPVPIGFYICETINSLINLLKNYLMAKGMIKTTSNAGGGTTGVTTTVGATGASGNSSQGITSPPGQAVTGTLQDVATGAIYNFSQSFGAELGIVVGAKVDYQFATIGGQQVANCIRLAHRGEITTINATDDGGTLLDKATGLTIPFAQIGANESGLAQGTKVNFERIIDPTSGQFTAVALLVVNG
jgi:hypothetical protein